MRLIASKARSYMETGMKQQAAGVEKRSLHRPPDLAPSLRLQSLTGIVLALLLLLVGPVEAYSALFGSLAVFLPGLMFTLLVMRKIGGDSAAFLGTAALAEFGKLALTALLCALVFVFIRPLAGGFFFLGMISTLVAGWIGLARAFRGKGQD
jgi:F0F1-type ATP synthase assembly protein I